MDFQGQKQETKNHDEKHSLLCARAVSTCQFLQVLVTVMRAHWLPHTSSSSALHVAVRQSGGFRETARWVVSGWMDG